MKIIFWGSDSFALPSLERISSHISLVVCQPDHLGGRNLKPIPPSTKIWARERAIRVLQPEKIRNNPDFRMQIAEEKADLSLVISYGKIIPEEILSLPKWGSINVHASLLPLLRGPSPIESAILARYKKTGLTIQQMVAAMDAGPILLQQAIPIQDNWNAGQLREVLSIKTADILSQFIERFTKREINPQPQDESAVTYCKKIDKPDLIIHWTEEADTIHAQIRALSPHYGAWTLYQGKRVKIWQSTLTAEKREETFPGRIIIAKGDKLIVATQNGALQLDSLQMENKKIVSSRDFINGMRIKAGDFFELPT